MATHSLRYGGDDTTADSVEMSSAKSVHPSYLSLRLVSLAGDARVTSFVCLSVLGTDQVMSEKSNYKSLVPSPSVGRRGAEKEEEGEEKDELRVCPSCEELFVRSVFAETTHCVCVRTLLSTCIHVCV